MHDQGKPLLQEEEEARQASLQGALHIPSPISALGIELIPTSSLLEIFIKKKKHTKQQNEKRLCMVREKK